MALSPNPAALPMFQRISFAAAASGGTAPLVSESTLLTCVGSGNQGGTNDDNGLPTQFITVFCSMSNSGATGTLAVFCADDDSVGSKGDGKLFWDTAALAAGTLRQSHETAAGNYIATVTFSISGKNTLDVHPGSGSGGRFPKWYAALTGISAGTAIIWVTPGRAI